MQAQRALQPIWQHEWIDRQLRDTPLIDAPKKPNMPNGKRSFVGANLFAMLCAEDGRINSPLRQSDRAMSVSMQIRMFELGVRICGTSLIAQSSPKCCRTLVNNYGLKATDCLTIGNTEKAAI